MSRRGREIRGDYRMKKWIQNTAGLILSVFLTLGLGAKVRAAGEEEDALPAPAPTEVSEPAPPAPEPAESMPALTEAPKPVEPPKPAETAPAAEAPKPVESEPAAETPKPSETAHADGASAPAEEPAPVEVPSPVEAPEPVEEAAPIEVLTPVEAPVSVAEDAPDEESVPVEVITPVEAPAPIDESTPVEEDAPVEPPAPIEDLTPAEDPSPAEEPFPAEGSVTSEEPVAAAAVPSVENPVPVPARSAAPMRALSSSTANGTGGESGDPAGAPDGSASADITVGGKDASEEDGWTYDESSGQVGLINFDRADIDIVSSGLNGLNIAAAGLNRLRSIVSEGDVSVTGTGLMLVDSVELGENSGFYLNTPTDIYADGTGSVALFIKSGENEYTLVNGSVVGLLDEQYTLTGVNLVVPDGSTLFLNSLGTVYDKDTHDVVFRFSGSEGEALAQQHGVTLGLEDESSTHGLDETYGTLTIGSGASLTVEQGGTVQMASTKGLRFWSDYSKPLLSAQNGGSLVIDGAVTGDGRITLNDGSSMTGTGSAQADQINVHSADALADCGVTFRSKMLRLFGSGTIPKLIIEDSDVYLGYSNVSAEISDLANSGSSRLIINEGGNLTLGSISNEGNISVYSNTESPSADSICNLTGVVTGGALRLSGGIFHLMDRFELTEGAALSYDHVIVYDHVDSSHSLGAPLIVSPGQVVMPEPAGSSCTVPLVVSFVTNNIIAGEFIGTQIDSTEFSEISYIKNSAGEYVLDLRKAECYKDGTNLLSQLLNSTDIPRTRRKTYIVEFHCMDEAGNLTVRSRKYFTGELEEILSSTDGDNAADLSFELGDTYLVRITVSNDYPILPSGTVTSPSTSFTGTGTLGGVGSLGSGSGTVLFRGSAYSHHDPQPASGGGGNPADPVNPDPVPSDPDPDPDPPAPDPPAPAPDFPAPDPDPDPNPEASLPAAAASDRRVIVSPQGRYYTVHVYFGTREADEPGQKITVRMKFKLPAGWSKNALFAVFRNADGSLTVIRADYDEDENTLSFDTDLTGTFALIFFPFDEDSTSEDFYEAISELDEIRLLPVRR